MAMFFNELETLATSSQPAMADDHLEQAGDAYMSSKKRKRGFEADFTLTGSLNFLSHYNLCSNGIPTPTLSTSSMLSEPTYAEPFPPAHVESSIDSAGHRRYAHPSKRLHVAGFLATSSVLSPLYRSGTGSRTRSATSPCHICRRAPTREDLSSYTDCAHCLQWTCSVCTRVCDGPRCQDPASQPQSVGSASRPGSASSRKLLCASCCQEVGVEGRVWCHCCYYDDTAEENHSLGKNKKELQFESAGRINDWLEDCPVDGLGIYVVE